MSAATILTLQQRIDQCIEVARRKHPTDRTAAAETFIAALSGVLQREDMALSNRVFALLAHPKKNIPHMSKKDMLIIEGSTSPHSMRRATISDLIAEEIGIGIDLGQLNNQVIAQDTSLVSREVKQEPANTRIAQPNAEAVGIQPLDVHVRIGNDTDPG